MDKKEHNHDQWDAADYAEHSTAQYHWAIELIEKIAIQKHESVLDIGCGDGKITAVIAEKCMDVTGIDSSLNMVEEARKAFPKPKYTNLSFTQMDASSLQFDNQFDVVFSNSALHWVSDHRPVLKGIYQALKPGGRCFLKFGGKGTLDAFQPMLDSLLSQEEWGAYFKDFKPGWAFFDDKHYEMWLQDAGFRSINTQLVPSKMTHSNRKGLEGWVRTTWHPYLNQLPGSLQNKFVVALIDLYLEKNPVDVSEKTQVDMVRLEVEARKPNEKV